MKTLVAAAVIVGALAAFFHIVVDSGGPFLVQKEEPGFADSFIFASRLGPVEFMRLPGAVQKKLAARKMERVGEGISDTLGEAREKAGKVIDSFTPTPERQ